MVEIISYWCLLVKGLNSVSRGQVLISSSLFSLDCSRFVGFASLFCDTSCEVLPPCFPFFKCSRHNDNRSKLKIVDAFTPRKEKNVSASEGYWFYMSPSFNALAIFSKDCTIKSTHYCFSEIKSVSENCFNPVTHHWRTWSSVSFELCRRDAPKGVSSSARCTISVHPLMKQL